MAFEGHDVIESTQESRQAEHSVALAREELRLAYQEQKKYEMTQEEREKKEEEERNRREQIDLDDVGVEIFRRRDRR